ncbi:phage tail tube protein [Arthrobacter sp. UYCu723]
MALENTPGSVASDGNLTLWFVPYGVSTNPASKAVIDAGTTKLITYSLTPDGFNHTTDEATVEDPRLTLRQQLQQAGVITDSLELSYVYGASDDVASVALTEGTKGWIVARYVTPNSTTVTVSTDKVDVLPIKCGVQRKAAPARNAVFTKMQKQYITGPVLRDVPVVA